MKVGDFVRFSHRVAVANNHLAIGNDRGVVVSMDGQSKASVVWSDGDKGLYRIRDLKRIPGVIGQAARSIGEKRNPLPDRGHKPHAVPARPIHVPRETAASWYVADETLVKGFVTTDKSTGEEKYIPYKDPLIRMDVRAHEWPGTSPAFTLVRSQTSLSVTFPNGEKQSMTPTGARTWMMGRFGAEMGEILATRMRVAQ